MAKLLVAPDIPQWLLDDFNDVDYKSVKLKAVKKQLLTALVSWANQNVPRKIKSKQYAASGEAKIIAKDFDKQLLDVLNSYDYTAITPRQEADIRHFIAKYKHYLPLKKKAK